MRTQMPDKLKHLLIGVALVMAIFLVWPSFALAGRGCCSWHGGQDYCDTSTGRWVCRDGTYSPTCTCNYKPPTPIIEKKYESIIEEIAFETQQKEDQNLPKGETKVEQEGKNGKKEITYKVTYIDGKETSREKSGEKVIEEPTPKIVVVGTQEPQDEQVTGASTNKNGGGSGWGWLIPLAIISAIIGIIVARRKKS